MLDDAKGAWTDSLSKAFRAYQNGRPVQEVECIAPDIAGISRGKAMPAYKFAQDASSFLPVSIFYQTITGNYVDLDIENQWTETDMVLVPDMSTACAVPWVEDMTVQIINDNEKDIGLRHQRNGKEEACENKDQCGLSKCHSSKGSRYLTPGISSICKKVA